MKLCLPDKLRFISLSFWYKSLYCLWKILSTLVLNHVECISHIDIYILYLYKFLCLYVYVCINILFSEFFIIIGNDPFKIQKSLIFLMARSTSILDLALSDCFSPRRVELSILITDIETFVNH